MQKDSGSMSKQNKSPNSALRENSYAGAAQQDEALWVELETLLRRCIRGLSLLSESTNAVVRTHTESLRRATHDGFYLHHIRDDLQQLADEIGAAVAAVFGAQPQQQAAFSTRPAPVLNEALLQLIERLDLPLEMNAACESLKQRLALPLGDRSCPRYWN
ncbi:MAG: hypothetical protein ABIT92_05365 [Gammaproteobacteria bacterium]